MSNFIIVSYYTLDTPYREVAHKYLMPCISNLKLKTDIRGVDNLGSWQKNTSYKAEFIKNMLAKHSENIVFLDCDAEILKYPELFNNIPEKYNFAAHMLDKKVWYRNNVAEGTELLSGTLFVRNNDRSRDIVNEWIKRCIAHDRIWEQKVLNQLLSDLNEKVYELPLEYCYIKTMPDGGSPFVICNSPVIVHNQVSRQLKRLIK